MGRAFRKFFRFATGLATFAALCPLTWATLPAGTGSFFWNDTTGRSDPDKPLDVYYYRPPTVDAQTPVWMIMHGTNRNGEDYRDYFTSAASALNAIVIAPEFSKADWAGSRGYNLGNISVSESDLTPRDKQDWSFSKIEPLYDHLVNVLEPVLSTDGYYMFGHSAGSQFTHRFLQWMPEARVKLAVAANAGWYTMPQYNDTSYAYDWPYSLSSIPDYDTQNSGYDPFPIENLEDFLEREMVVLLGDDDTRRTSSLRQTTEADAQGQHRYERGQFFFDEAQAEASARNLEFGWDLQIVSGVGHSASQMAIRAAELFRLANLSPADFNQDSLVNGRDLDLWKSAYGTVGTADANDDGDSDGLDFLGWQRLHGNTVASVSNSLSVPEPTSGLIAFFLLAQSQIACSRSVWRTLSTS